MSIRSTFWLFILLSVNCAYYLFIIRGKKYGYLALATRTDQLLEQGVGRVWLLYGNKGVGQNNNLAHTSVWTLLNTGFLAYAVDQTLVIESPWWKKMRPLVALKINQITLNPTTIVRSRRTYPALHLGHQSYVILGINLKDAYDIKQLLKMQNHEGIDALLATFMDALITPSSAYAESNVTDISLPA